MHRPRRRHCQTHKDKSLTSIQSANATEAGAASDSGLKGPHELTLAFDDNKRASLVYGQYDQNIAHIERQLGVIATVNGNHITLKGSRESAGRARRTPGRTSRAMPTIRSQTLRILAAFFGKGNSITAARGKKPTRFDRKNNSRCGRLRAMFTSPERMTHSPSVSSLSKSLSLFDATLKTGAGRIERTAGVLRISP